MSTAITQDADPKGAIVTMRVEELEMGHVEALTVQNGYTPSTSETGSGGVATHDGNSDVSASSGSVLNDSASSVGAALDFREMRRQTLVFVATADGRTAAIPLIDWDETSAALDSAGYLVLKRAIDVVGAMVGLILLSPVMLMAMLIVWWQDGGPVIFSQLRVGLNGDRFRIFKIRTMVKDAEARMAEVADLNHHDDRRTFKAQDDPRVLSVGKFLRRYSVDEFPQLVNVLWGEMSLVGPRPPLPDEVGLYDASDYVRLAVKPGLTCYWQISGRGTIPFKQQVELDRRYIRESSTLTDLKIIFKTVPSMLKSKGAH